MPLCNVAQAWAQGEAAKPSAPTGPLALIQNPLTMLVIIFGIFYFLIIRPQQKKQKDHQEMLNKIDKGDRVITTGGIYGTVLLADAKVLTLQIDDKVKIKVSRSAIAGKASDNE